MAGLPEAYSVLAKMLLSSLVADVTLSIMLEALEDVRDFTVEAMVDANVLSEREALPCRGFSFEALPAKT